MQIKLIGIRAFALGHRITPFAIASAAIIVFVAGEKERDDVRRHVAQPPVATHHGLFEGALFLWLPRRP